ncbi:MAG: alpha/beta hydrolase [Thermoanaerobaculia bacterium]
MNLKMVMGFAACAIVSLGIQAQEVAPPAAAPTAQTAPPVGRPAVPQSNSSFIDSSGTAHITRVIPVSPLLSPEARTWMARQIPDADIHLTIEQIRAAADASQARTTVSAQSLYPTKIVEETIGGVPVKVVTPPTIPAAKRDRVLICLHGGGFIADWGSATESIPIASLTQTKVVAIRYRLSPEHAFPAAVDDVVAVYQQLLKTYRAGNIGVYGTSAGAALTAEFAVRLQRMHLPLPAALGVFSGWGDFSRSTDSLAMYGLMGLSGAATPDCSSCSMTNDYAKGTDPQDPLLSPVFADLKGLPPTLFLTSTRDLLLSGTTQLHLAFLKAEVPAELIVFEGLPHAFWAAGPRTMPEAIETNRIIAAFFDRHLGLRARPVARGRS